jgi:hypothetical protein
MPGFHTQLSTDFVDKWVRFGIGTQGITQAKGHVRRNRSRAVQNARQRSTGDAQAVRRFGNAQISQKLAQGHRMS